MRLYRDDNQAKKNMQAARSALQPYTYMRGPHFFGLAFSGIISWFLSGVLDKRHFLIVFFALYAVSSYSFLYIKKRLGWTQLSWKQILILELQGYAVVVIVFFIADRIGFLRFSDWGF